MNADVYTHFRTDYLHSMSRGDTDITVRVLLNRINGVGLGQTTVYATGDESNASTTDERGRCRVRLRNTKPGDPVTLALKRDKFTVVDPGQLRITVPTATAE